MCWDGEARSEGTAQKASICLHISPSSFPRGVKGGGKNVSQDLQVVLCLVKIVCAPVRCRARSEGLQRASARSHCPPALVGWGKESEIEALYWGGKISQDGFINRMISWRHKNWQHPQSSQNSGRRMSFTGAGMLHGQFLADTGGKGVS